jgi:hypothetical protein
LHKVSAILEQPFQPFSSELGDHAVVGSVSFLMRSQHHIIAIQKHRQRNLADNPLTTTNPATNAVFDAPVAYRAWPRSSGFPEPVDPHVAR